MDGSSGCLDERVHASETQKRSLIDMVVINTMLDILHHIDTGFSYIPTEWA